jgi:hypothetical protein
MGIFNLWQARRVSPLDTVTRIPDLAPVSEQARYYRRMLWLTAVAFPPMTVWMAYDLRRLESGAAEHLSISAPIAVVYEHFGFWPAVLVLPGLGILCFLVCVRKLRKLRSRESTESV